jgi:hypothetical protein
MKTSLIALLLLLSLGAAHAQNQSKATGFIAQRLAACKNNAGMNLIKREECIWSMCKGRWGRDGCPKQASATVPR